MKKILNVFLALALALSLSVSCLAAEYTGSDEYGDQILSVADDGSFTYRFSQETHGFAVTLVASGTITDAAAEIILITNPDMNDMDVTAMWDTAMIAADIMTLYTGEEHEPVETQPSADVPASEPQTEAPAGNATAMDPVVLEPIASVVAGTYTGRNDYGEATLELSANGSYTYVFFNSVFGDILGLEAYGQVVDGQFVTNQVVNPTMGYFDATSDYNITEFGYQIKSVYLGLDWSNDAYAAYLASQVDPEAAARIESTRIPTLVVTLILLVVIIAVTCLALFLKYKKLWKAAEAGGGAEQTAEERPQYDRHQIVNAELYGDTIPVLISVNAGNSCFAIRYTVMGNELSAEGSIVNGEYVLERDASSMVKNMLNLSTPLLTDQWQSGSGQ